MQRMLIQERLKELLHYDPDTGVFTRLINKGKTRRGEHCKATSKITGYGMIGIDYINYYRHRLAFLYMEGRMPPEQVDHINGIRTDNRWCNLRHATDGQNKQNKTKAQANNKTGYLGVCWHSGAKKYMARVELNGKSKYIGIFNTAEEAHQAYLVSKRELHNFCTI